MKLLKFIPFILFFNSCHSQVKINYPDFLAKELNNKAMKNFLSNESNKDSILNALELIDKAILIDSTFYPAYESKVTLLCSLGRYFESIDALDKSLIIKPNVPETEMLKGFILERIGNNVEALKTYNIALDDYNKKIKLDSSNVSLLLSRAFTYFFIDNYQRGMQEYEIISKKYPGNRFVSEAHELFYSFDRKAYINDLFPATPEKNIN